MPRALTKFSVCDVTFHSFLSFVTSWVFFGWVVVLVGKLNMGS